MSEKSTPTKIVEWVEQQSDLLDSVAVYTYSRYEDGLETVDIAAYQLLELLDDYDRLRNLYSVVVGISDEDKKMLRGLCPTDSPRGFFVKAPVLKMIKLYDAYIRLRDEEEYEG
ncbi:hypothetical protein ABEO98_21695 [Brevibacillus parabrevis]|uniref:hypothetical protein n=1 Tax=Brevibacillus parabrevis TaxID=54914 RepID=UPI002E220226|nr:hypothetical protein [Brevibacillus parabrevis]